jgi:hypothetical protein
LGEILNILRKNGKYLIILDEVEQIKKMLVSDSCINCKWLFEGRLDEWLCGRDTNLVEYKHMFRFRKCCNEA